MHKLIGLYQRLYTAFDQFIKHHLCLWLCNIAAAAIATTALLCMSLAVNTAQAQVQNITPPSTFYPAVQISCTGNEPEYNIYFSEQSVNGQIQVSTYIKLYNAPILEYAVRTTGSSTELFFIVENTLEPYLHDPSLYRCYRFNLGFLPLGVNNLTYIVAGRDGFGFTSNFVSWRYAVPDQTFVVRYAPTPVPGLDFLALVLLFLAIVIVTYKKRPFKIALVLLLIPLLLLHNNPLLAQG
ncbi:MAG: hypothetical protein RLZZ502_190, partial [Pseudomonadota bacterium]